MARRTSAEMEQSHAVILRRSPRFLQTELTDPEDPETPKPLQQRGTRVASPLTLTGNKKVSSRRRSCKPKSQERSLTLDETADARQVSGNPKTGLRRSGRLNHCADDCSAEKLLCSSNQRNREMERRVTSCQRDTDKNTEKTSHGGFTRSTNNTCSSHKPEKGVTKSKQFKGKLLKNKVKHMKTSGDDNHDGLDDNANEGVSSITKKPVSDEGLSEKFVDKRDVNDTKKNVGVKRKRNQFEEIVGIAQGWTKDQESALEIAYLKAKPTPHFWKKVSRLVPGKSAQECFDKIHGNHLTPQPHTRSKSKISNSQNTSLSATNLLTSSTPTTKKPKPRKQKTHIIQRNVRHMLQNQYNKTQQDSETDLFSVLEPTFTPLNLHLKLRITPDSNKNTGEILKRCREGSSMFHKKSLSRFNSPPVLKPVKNKALHEKYIDLLNCREANRKGGKAGGSKGMKVEGSVERKEAIKAAKNALVFDAKDAINEFQHQEAMALIDSFNEEDEDGEGFV